MTFKLQKYFYAFGICVGIPCLVLGYMAYRGIRNDQALVEQEIEQTHKQVLIQIESGLTSYSDLVESVLSAYLDKPDSIATIAAPFISIDSTVICVFRLAESQRFYFYPPLLYQNSVTTPTSTATLFTLAENPVFQEAQRLEFQDHQFDRAIQYYHDLEKTVHDSSDLALIFMALARNYQKSQRYESALAYWQQLKTGFDHQKIQSEVPTGLLAAIAEIEILKKLNRKQEMFQSLNSLYEKILNHSWSLSESSYHFYVEKIRTYLSALLKPEDQSINSACLFEINRLRKIEEIKYCYTEWIKAFQNTFYQSLKNFQNTIGDQSDWTRHEILAGHNHYPVSLKTLSDKPDWRYLGILWNPPKLCQSIIDSLKKRSIATVIHGLQITDFDGSQFFKTGFCDAEMMLMSQSISSDYFPWKIMTYYKPAPFWYRLFTTHRSIYFMIFLMIGCVLCFSFIFFNRAMRLELEFLALRSRFISTVSHEFKGPLTAIIQLAQLLETKRVKTLARRQVYYRIILEQSQKLSSLIDNLLNFSRLKQKQWTYYFEEITLAPFLEDILQKFREKLKDTNWQIQLQKLNNGIVFQGDRLAMEIVFNNLIDNAIKYSKSVNKLDVTLTSDQDKIQIAIRDYGIGMNADEVSKIFHEFYRGKSTAMKTVRGSGLGLTIVQQIIADHQGRIKVESTPGKGSIFIVELPLTKEVRKNHL